MVSAGVASFPCTVTIEDDQREHEGPCAAIESPPSQARRRAWVEEQGEGAEQAETERTGAEARGRLAGHQGRPVGSSEAMDGAAPLIEQEWAAQGRGSDQPSPSLPPPTPVMISLVHMAPGPGEQTMPCCGAPFHDMPFQDTVTRDPDAVTCPGRDVSDDALSVSAIGVAVREDLTALCALVDDMGAKMEEFAKLRTEFISKAHIFMDDDA